MIRGCEWTGKGGVIHTQFLMYSDTDTTDVIALVSHICWRLVQGSCIVQ